MSQQMTLRNVMEIRPGIRPGIGAVNALQQVKGTDAAAPVQVVLNCPYESRGPNMMKTQSSIYWGPSILSRSRSSK